MNHITHFDKRLEQIPNKIWSKIAYVDELKGRWSAGVNLSPEVLKRLKRSVLVTSTGASTRIEGGKLSDEEIEKMIRGISIEKFSNRDEAEAQGYFELLSNVFNAWDSLKLNENTIKHFHQELLKYTQKDLLHRGRYKSKENQVRMIGPEGEDMGVLFDTTPAYLTPKEVNELVEWTNQAFESKKYHPLLIIGNFIVEFLSIHPFEDGNGRLSRILTNLLLLKQGYLYTPYVSHEKLIEDSKADYYLALRNSQKTFRTGKEDLSFWLDFFLKILSIQSELAIELMTSENIESMLSSKQLAVWQYLQETNDASPMEIAKKINIARITVNQVLNKLLKIKRIERIGQGSGIRYRKK
ncbi:MAG: Fic family protein [Candidatus Levybacteria bacterium]|nr:Fic family protein [Candidatus Levybacteria bacterium]